ncbi:uncharacterized protein [Cicer arietinum]|uniref:Histone-lysine N-methyltransferase, H3 lysine-79 specific-like isoform X2 n=1 Tax=Cicer arietinum TaxID=3827 RepID=A0A3Q7Y7U7_CICAR|nr:histone-lysine N-methyltransferase, H3 lysine-79 specific-like isoform X2 [Cicer arietinum]
MKKEQTKNLKEKKHNKIRKRGSTSTSSSSTFTRKYRYKRAILVAKKSGYSTPSPMWKTTSMSTNHHHNHAIKNTSLHSSKEKKELSVSARKLAATLWELNDLTPSMVKKEPMRINKDRDKDRVQSLCRSVLLGPHKLDPSYSSTSFSEVNQRIKGIEVDGDLSHHLQFADHDLRCLDGCCNDDLMEKESNKLKDKRNCGKCKVGVKNYLKEAKSGLSTLNKLLKVLSQMVHEEKHSFRSIPLILGMSNELDRVRNQIDGFIEEQSSNQTDIEYLMKHFAEENSAWKRREREKIRATMMSLTQELEVEKKLRRQTERLNMKIVNEMENVKYSYSKLSKEHKREKRAKEILEQVCDELAQGIGEDRAKVEEMKRESEKVLEEVEKEREMLQLADVLREERVHMKLSEAKYQFEEKNEMLENLRNELESFFKSKEKEKGGDDDGVNEGLKKLKDFEFYLNKTCLELQNLEADNHLNVGDAIEHEDESAETESDLQSIELNMDNENKSYNWSYACENVAHFEAKRVSIDKDIGRRSFSDWGSICFNKGTPKGNKQKEFGLNIDESFDKLERERSIEFVFGDEIEKDKKVRIIGLS